MEPHAPARPDFVFVVDDEQDNLDFLVRALSGVGEVRAFADPRAALQAVSEERPAALVVDYKMPHLNGVELVQAVRAKGIRCGVVMVTAFPELDEVCYAQQVNLIYQIVPKPTDAQHLRSVVQLAIANAFYRDALAHELALLRQNRKP